MRNRLITTEPKQLEYYRGKLIHADTSLHDQVESIVREYVAPGATILDVGAGAGAFSLRLADAGYAVAALDVDPDKWDCSEISFHHLDINKGVARSVSETFDAACCLEVIEHVENPWNLLRDLLATVKPGGRLILSTPNISSFLSRLLFLRSGKFHQFQEQDLAYGHISPITCFELSMIAQEVGWRIIDVSPGGYLPVLDLTSYHPKAVAMNLLRALAYIVSRGQRDGWVLIFTLEKPAA